jgi:RNA-splicing ligase RtcB
MADREKFSMDTVPKDKFKIFLEEEHVEIGVYRQLVELLKIEAFADAKIRIMPDTHPGSGCVIGYTSDIPHGKVIPNIVGVDQGCGMLTANLGKSKIDLNILDYICNHTVPSGMDVNDAVLNETEDMLLGLKCYSHVQKIDRVRKSVGSLGGGNHFIELDEDDEGNHYLVIHSGSRNLGLQVAEHYQNMACDIHRAVALGYWKEKMDTAADETERALYKEKLKKKYLLLPANLAYLDEAGTESYLHDHAYCVEFARINRETILSTILDGLAKRKVKFDVVDEFQTVHNYIDMTDGGAVIRKGAVSAREGERLIIPINMRDGSLICVGKGNEDWNYSAPHGAGRLLGRKDAKNSISMSDYRKSMEGIFSTSVTPETVDEAPMAYKPLAWIVDNIAPTVDIVKQIKPVYNFKASEEAEKRGGRRR